jgi:phosphatidylglycerol:prolipoprotein diacylglycerol transferase
MYPILVRFGPFFIYSFTVVSGLSLVLGIGIAYWQQKRDRQPTAGWFDAILIALTAGILGGRAVFVIVNWSYYRENIGELIMVSRGGLNYHGVLVVGLIAFWGWVAWRDRQPSTYVALLPLPLTSASVLGWLACWLDGCAYGRPAEFGLLAADLPDSFGVYGLRYQTQLMGFLLCLLVLVIIVSLRGRLKATVLFWSTLLSISTVHLIITLFRGDPAPVIGQIRLDALVDSALVISSLLAMMVLSTRSSPWRQRDTLPPD